MGFLPIHYNVYVATIFISRTKYNFRSVPSKNCLMLSRTEQTSVRSNLDRVAVIVFCILSHQLNGKSEPVS